MAVDDVSQCLQAAQRQVQELKAASVGDNIDELSSQLSTTLRTLESRIKTLQHSQINNSATVREATEKKIEEFKKTLRKVTGEYRTARTAALAKANKARRTELIQGRPSEGLSYRGKAGNAERDASKLTADLRAAQNLMRSHLAHNEASIQTLVESSETVNATKNEFGAMGGALDQGNSILDKMKSEEVIDKMFVYSGFAIFLLTVLYIIYARTIGRFI